MAVFPVPPLPARHGCTRIPMFAAGEFSKLATVGMVAIIYDKTEVSLSKEKE
jgi:hypothetical protein